MKDNKLISELTYDTLYTGADSQMSLNNLNYFLEWVSENWKKATQKKEREKNLFPS